MFKLFACLYLKVKTRDLLNLYKEIIYIKRFFKRLWNAFRKVTITIIKAVVFGVLVSIPILFLTNIIEYLTGSTGVALGILGLILFVGLIAFFFIFDIPDNDNK